MTDFQNSSYNLILHCHNFDMAEMQTSDEQYKHYLMQDSGILCSKTCL
jgi:hypothetical protein